MASLDSILTRQALARGVVRQTTNDAQVGIRMRYIGTGTVTSVTVITATSVANITSDGGTDTYAFATYATIGALADAINSDRVFEVRVLDALRSEASAGWFLAAAPVTAGTGPNGEVVYDLVADTSGATTFAVCLSSFGTGFDAPKGHLVHLLEIYYSINNTAAATALQVWHRTGGVETQLLGMVNVDQTATAVNFASGQGKISSKENSDLIVYFNGTVINDAANFARVTGIYE